MKLMLQEVGDWIRFPETVHELYAHLAQFIGTSYQMKVWWNKKWKVKLIFLAEANENKGLKRVSEENLEVYLTTMNQNVFMYFHY